MAHSSANKSGVFCRRKCCIAFGRCDGALFCMNTQSLIFKSLWCLVSTSSHRANKKHFIQYQYFSVTSWVTSFAWQISKVQTVLYSIAKAILPVCVFSKAENWGRFYEPPGIIWTCCSNDERNSKWSLNIDSEVTVRPDNFFVFVCIYQRPQCLLCQM